MAPKVLLLEDQKEITTVIQLILENENLEIYMAETVAEAEHLVKKIRFDVALVDGSLPDKSPLAFIESLVKKECQVILMSGNFEPFKPIKTLPCLYLEKPFRMAELLTRVQQALSQAAAPLHSES